MIPSRLLGRSTAGLLGVVAAIVLGGGGALIGAMRPNVLPGQSDLDDFMSQVLARRDENWKKLQQYVLDERDEIKVTGPGGLPLWGDRRSYTWYIREGFFVQSPVAANGVKISDGERQKSEDEFLRRAKARDRRGRVAPQAGSQIGTPASSSPEPPIADDLGGLLVQNRQPEFIDSAYFLRFKFEAGKYALVGRETLDGQEVLRIEYYPARLFSHEQDAAARRKADGSVDRSKDTAATLEQMMNKVALVTLWVAPDTHQIVKYVFDNVSFDFLPAAWFVRVNNAQATMTMGQPFKSAPAPPPLGSARGGLNAAEGASLAADVWLPHDVDMKFGATLAIGPIDLRYHLDYENYRRAATSGRLIAPDGQ